MSTYLERPRFSCAFTGAIATVGALPRAIPVLHSAPGCAGNLAWTQLGGSGLQTGGYCATLSIPSSNLQEREVVFGGAERLKEQIAGTLEVMDGDLFFVLTGCVPEMIGDDVQTVAAEFRGRGIDILVAETAGFKGNSYVGYDLVLQALFRQYVRPATKRAEKTVNLWGVPPVWDPFWRGNLEALRTLLEQLGLRVNSFFTRHDTLAAIGSAAEAQCNLVVSDVYGVEAARVFEEKFGTPFLSHPLPVGPAGTESFLRAVGSALALPQKKVTALIEKERRYYLKYVASLIDSYSDIDLQRYAVVVGDANYAVSLTRFLADDFGWLPEVAVCTDALDDKSQQTLREHLGALDSGIRPELVFETDTSKIPERFRALKPAPPPGRYADPFSPAFVVGSSLDREFAQSIAADHLSVSFPVANRAVLNRGYTGHGGGLHLIEDLCTTIVARR